MNGQTKRYNLTGLMVVGLLFWCMGTAFGQATAKPDDRAKMEFFETNVRPVLFEKCYSCHGAQVQQAGLRLDSREGFLKGGTKGASIVPGDPDKSLFIKAIRYEGAIKMPPSGQLKPAEIEALTAWIKMGAPWPQAPTNKPTPVGGHWAFRPVKKPTLPKVKNTVWATHPIDKFVLAKMEAKGVKPNPSASRATLIRRIYFGLVGVPPTNAEVNAFINDKSPNAYEKLIDQLLASPKYGERWGRYWLDVARYADTKGYVFTEDVTYHNAYTYRDWVIRSVNEDLPYNQFLIQQLAADLLQTGDDRRPLAALGFLTVGRRFLNDQVLINDDRIDVTTRGLMGLTVACARCHDHKFDPVPAQDYYSLYGVFMNSHEPNPPPAISPKEISEPFEQHNAKIVQAKLTRDTLIQNQMTRLREIMDKTPDNLPKDIRGILQSIRIKVLPDARQLAKLRTHFVPTALENLTQTEKQLEELNQTVPQQPEFGMTLRENASIQEPYVFKRGNPGNRGEQVPRRFLAVLSSQERKPFTKGSGRLELAQAIASPDNPLTARVFVNRVWMYHLGAGLVRTPGDFGIRGEAPTHPELLDWLASSFMEQGWSVKRLHKMILLSNTYKQTSDVVPATFQKDPDNRLITRQNRQRLDLEAMRDALLYVSGELDTSLYGKAVEITKPSYSKRRTVYGFIDRQNLQGLFRTFDFASPDTSTPQRFRTTIPQQSLFMMNSPFVVDQAKALARRSEVEKAKSDTERIQSIYRLVLSREPNAEELNLGVSFLTGVGQLQSGDSKSLKPVEAYIQTLLMTNEFAFVD